MIDFPDISESDWRWKHFSHDEMKCKGSGECRMDPSFMDFLEEVRSEYGKPMIIVSGYRSPSHNARVSNTGATGPHTKGQAADVAVSGTDAHRLLKIALAHGVRGVGVKQKGNGRFLHLDNTVGDLRPWVWSY